MLHGGINIIISTPVANTVFDLSTFLQIFAWLEKLITVAKNAYAVPAVLLN